MAWAPCRLTSVLPADLRRYLYIDVDTLVGRDLCELLEQDLGGKPIGMVLNDQMSEKDRAYVLSQSLDPDRYFNTGVLLMDGQQFRSGRFDEGLLRERDALTYDPWFPDQDVMNSFFRGRIATLAQHWNLRDAGAKPQGHIIHFTGRPKPWELSARPDSLPAVAAWHDCNDAFGYVPPVRPGTQRRQPAHSRLWAKCVRRLRRFAGQQRARYAD
jgi:lipopolysaccharide biosynthesis glycosyltransferase